VVETAAFRVPRATSQADKPFVVENVLVFTGFSLHDLQELHGEKRVFVFLCGDSAFFCRKKSR
jgi:hypothetical protein